MAAFQAQTGALMRQTSSAANKLNEAANRIKHIKAALIQTPKADQKLFAELKQLEQDLAQLKHQLNGDPIRQKLNENSTPSIRSRVGTVAYGHWKTTQKPTQTQADSIEIATADFKQFQINLKTYLEKLEKYEAKLEAAEAPYTPGRSIN